MSWQTWYGSEYRHSADRLAQGSFLTGSCPNGANDDDDFVTFDSCFVCPNASGIESYPTFDEHWGCAPTDAFPTAAPDTTHNFLVKFHPKMQAFNPTEPVRVCPRAFHCDDRMVLEEDPDNDGYFDVSFTADPNSAADNAYCSPQKYNNDPDWTLIGSPCAPWQEVYGFYTGATIEGTDTPDRANYNAELVMKAVDYDKCFVGGRPTSCSVPGSRNPAIGDYINLEGEVSVEYFYSGNAGKPYLAFFTGGDRLHGCAYANQNPGEFPGYDADGVCSDTQNEYGLNQPNGLLRNNAQGRYRLETTVFLSVGGLINKSPVIMMPPLVVLQSRPQGTPISFKIPAYDPEDDAFEYRMGNHNEYGGLIRSTVDAFPYLDIYTRLDAIGQTGLNSSGFIGYDVNATSPTRGMMKPFPRSDLDYPVMRQLGNFGCNFYDITRLETGNCSSDRLAGGPIGSSISADGTVSWHAWANGAGACDAASDAGCSRLATGLYNFVVMVEEVAVSGTGRIKVPVDFLVYLYDGSVSFCGESCLNAANPPTGAPLPIPNAGLPTFVDRDGVYGTEPSETSPNSQSCTICAADGATQPCNAADPLQPQLCTCNVNTAPRFYQSPTKEHNNIPETPQLTEWQNHASSGGTVEMPYMTFYLGETIEFYVSAYDEDDCAEVYIDATSLPFGDGAQAILSEALHETEYPTDIGVVYPKGAFTRKKFTWSANLGGLPYNQDSRPGTSVVCFTASDKYLYHTDGTSSGMLNPYCVEIRLVAPPPQTEQSLFRFEWDPLGTCSDPKLAISWHPTLLRYVFVDQGVRYYTKCKFEQYMWHHVIATIEENRTARLYVDGEIQELMREVGQDPLIDATYDKGIDVGTDVTVIAYVNKCKADAPPAPYWWTCGTDSSTYPGCPGYVHQRADRRRLSSIYDPREPGGTLNILSDKPVSSGFLYVLNTTSGYVEDPELPPPTGDCCGFSMGLECAGESNSFDGFIDEVVVYNRAVAPEDIKGIMFKMPQYLPARELEAPRGVQLDLSAGRVLWTRFNNPCMEGEIPADVVEVVAPEDGGSFVVGGRRLQQITKPSHREYDLLSTDAVNNTGRRMGVSDKAGMSAGGAYVGADVKTYYALADSDSDRTQFIRFRDSAKYAYTGVPWLAPTISRVEVDRTLISTANPLPLDGGLDVTLSGVGFARSPWLKCVSAQPDVRAKYEADVLASAEKYEARSTTDSNVYNNFFGSMSTREMMIESSPWMYEDMEGLLFEAAETLLEPDEYSPYLLRSSVKHPQQKGPTAYEPQCTIPSYDPLLRCPMNEVFGWENAPTCAVCPDEGAVRTDWHPSNLRNPKTPPYEKMPWRSELELNAQTTKYVYALWDDFIYGGWEKVTCSVPAAAFPSDHYYVGVSNDGGMTGSPSTSDEAETVTFTEYAFEADGVQYVEIQSDRARGRTYSLWFMPKDVTGYQNLFNISDGIGVAMQDGGMVVTGTDGTTQYPKDGETAATVSTGEWHHAVITMSGISNPATLKLFLDGQEILTDGEVTLESTNPALLSAGDGFIGYMDEIKVFQSAKADEVIYDVMWSREKPNPNLNNLKLYMRFNAPTGAFKDGKQQGLADSSGNFVGVACAPADISTPCPFLPVPAPWEPVSLYEINDMGPSVFSFPMTGGDELKVKGFNFAPSQWTQCGWSRELVEVYSRTYPVTQDISGNDMCPYSVGSLNSILGKPEQLKPYAVYEFNPDNTAFTAATVAGFSSWADDYEKTTMLDCTTPQIEPDVYHMSVSGQKFLNVFPFEITDVSLYCNGKDVYLTAPPADIAAPISSSTRGYTFSAWVMPFATPEADDARPRDVASDKLGHRRAYLPMEKPEQTIFAMENPSGGDVKHAGALMYDGVRFVYYDDCILDATGTLDAGSRPNEWHYVVVRIDEEGEGDLFVDGIMVEHFTTVCKPQADASFSLCMDEDINGQPSAFFHGLIDEVKVVNQKLDDADLIKYMFNQKAHDEQTRTLAYYTFDSCSSDTTSSSVAPAELPTLGTVGPVLSLPTTACEDGMLVSSSGPWRPARFMGQDTVEGGVSGFHKIRVVGANLAVSQWLGVTFDGVFHPALEMDGPNVMLVDSPVVSGEANVSQQVANWAGAASLTSDASHLPPVSAEDTVMLTLAGSVQDLGTGLEAYYTFDAAPISDATPDEYVLYDFAGNSHHGAFETGLQVPDRDGYENGAILVDDVVTAHLPAPATYMDNTVYSVCIWVHFSYGENQASTTLPKPFSPLYGAWKMYSMVRKESGDFDIYINTEPTSEESIRETFQQAIDGYLETGKLLFNLTTSLAIDDMWVYSRALSPTEIIARYYTNAVAIDFGKPALDTAYGSPNLSAVADPTSPSYSPTMMVDGETVAPVMIANLPVPEKPTFTAWVYPWEGQEGLSTIFADSEGLWSLGVWDQRLSFFVYADCPCEPCNQMREVVSWRARVLPGRWTHVAAKYDKIESGIEGEVITLYIDGVLVDKEVFSEFGDKPIMSSGAASVGSDMDGSRRFNGLIYSVGIHDEFVPWQIKREVQCPQREPEDFVLYMGGSKAAAFGNRSVTMMGVAPESATGAMLVGQLPASAYVNATYDDITVIEAVTFSGTDKDTKFGGYDGDYTITARTTCGKKRVMGGDAFQVNMAKVKDSPDEPDFDTSSLVSVTDGSDGNYHVSYTGLQCGTYETAVTLSDGTDVTSFNTIIMPGPTDPSTSLLLTQQSGDCLGPFGIVHTLQIQSKDFSGCDQTDGTDVISVSIRGPADITVPAVHVSGGLYEAKFVPPAAGKYFVEVKLTNAEFVDPVDFTTTPYLCIDICDGHSINFDGTGSVETSPDLTEHMDSIQDTGAITMEAWVSPTAATAADGYILFKGTVAEADDDDSALAEGYSKIKGYSLRVTADLQHLIGTVYLGLGEYLVLEMQLDFQTDVWAHVAVTYDGMVMKGYRNGQLMGETTPSAEARPMHHNLYGHPLNVGYRFNGKIDEATVWTRALSTEEVAAKQWCPKYLDMEDVVVYVPFNDDPASTDMAAFVGPTLSASAPFMPFAAPAVVPSTPGGFVLEAGTPLDGATKGVGSPGDAYSIISPGDDVSAGVFESVVLNLQAFDQCGFHYIGQGEGDFKLQLTQYSYEYYTQLDPIADNVPMYPIMIQETPMPLVDARGLAGTCYAAEPSPPYYRGDLYDVVGEAVAAGKYYGQVTTRSGEILQDLIEVEVVAKLGEQSEVVISPIPSTEAGVESAVRFSLSDGFDNIIMDDHSQDLAISVYQTDSGAVIDTVSVPMFEELTGEYLVSFLAGSPVQHTIEITVTSVNKMGSAVLSKDRPTWRKLLTTDGDVPEGIRRFEAGGAADPETGDLFLWGGASYAKSYMNDVWALRAADIAAPDVERTVLAYQRVITVTSAEPMEKAMVVEITIDTEDLISAGKLHHKCQDLYFTMPGNGDYLKYYVDTFADHSCGTKNTIVYLNVPGGILMEAGATLDIEMYYGAPGHYWPNPNSDAAGIFAFYEGFESGTMGSLKSVEPCTQEPAADSGGFVVEEFEEAYSGAYALHATVGARGLLSAVANSTLESFTMRAWFWDSNAHEAAHYVSPDYSGCGMTAGMDPLLPGGGPITAPSTAVGAYTLSHVTKYCVSSPWQASARNDLRSAQWHRLEITSTPETGLSVSVDGRVIKTADSITYDKVLISTGYSADGVGHDFLADAHAYFDEISVRELSMCGSSSCLTSSVATSELGVVKYVGEIGWEKLDVDSSTAPPARQGHSASTYNGGMLIFGGERSSYAFNDVWWFSFVDQTWTYLAAKSSTAPPARFDHAASVANGKLFIAGGRSGTGDVLSDMWVMDLMTQEWMMLAETSPAGARFGHTAAFGPSGDYVYLFGGFARDESAGDFSGAFMQCLVGDDSIECTDITEGCPDLNVPSSARAIGVGLTARTGHTMLPTATGLVVFGGGDASDLEPRGAFAFAEATCQWSRLSVAAGELQGSNRVIEDITRHDHVAMKMTTWMAVQGGIAGGDFKDDLYVLSIP